MQNSRSNKCSGCRVLSQLTIVLIAGLYQVSSQAELATLFTTPQERQIINSNRYKTDELRPVKEGPKQVVRQQTREEVKQSFLISGFTVSSDGEHSVWINNQMYEDGEQVEGNNRIKVIVGKEIKVRITTPDGKQHYGTIGESVEVSYLEASDI